MSQGELAAPPALPTDAGLSPNAALARAALMTRSKTGGGAWLLIVSFVLFTVTMPGSGVRDLIVLILVVLVHEGGHLLGMRAFGFTDLGMFFLPFFGAAATGEKRGATACEHAIVSLLGPLPGILLALLLLCFAEKGEAAWHGDSPPLLSQIVMLLSGLNLLNLLPILPLDGGRFFEVLVFGRRPMLDIAFRVVAILALAWLAAHGITILYVPAGLFALTLPRHARVAFLAARLGRTRRYAADPAALGDDELRALWEAADGAIAWNAGDRKRVVVATVCRIFDRVARQPASFWQTAGLLLLWAFALVLGVAELLVLAVGWPLR